MGPPWNPPSFSLRVATSRLDPSGSEGCFTRIGSLVFLFKTHAAPPNFRNQPFAIFPPLFISSLFLQFLFAFTPLQRYSTPGFTRVSLLLLLSSLVTPCNYSFLLFSAPFATACLACTSLCQIPSPGVLCLSLDCCGRLVVIMRLGPPLYNDNLSSLPYSTALHDSFFSP